jgi:hypothetical protein
MKRLVSRILRLALLASLPAGAAMAQAAPFDLAGPTLLVRVTHGASTLPIGQVPNLSPGDQVSIKADLPPEQSVHYLLVAAFLRGATNPPPDSWFYRAETWTRKGRDGLKITVPADAQQAVVFLAPETGGDFRTLVDAVRGKPGAFVRASQDLNQASLDRSRLDAFLRAVRKANPSDPDQLKTVSPLLARSLTIKLNTDCFQKMPELQAPCLMQGSDQLVLNDGHSTSIVEALTGGATADLAMQISNSSVANFGYYSPYVAAAMDIAHILEGFRTAQFQYIPALARPHGDQLQLVLNAPPSFHNPLSVMVTALPAVEPPQSPPLQPVDPKAVHCAERTDLVLPVEGAPLVFSTEYAHDMVLRLKDKDGRPLDIPVRADAEKGGLIADTSAVAPDKLGTSLDGSLHGYWGFTAFDGPAFHLQNAHSAPWRLAADEQQSLVVGREDTVHLQGAEASCVESVTLQQAGADPVAAQWKASAPDQVAVTVPLADAQPGTVTLHVKQYGMSEPDAVPLQSYAQSAHLDGFTLHAGDGSGELKGTRLDEVASLSLSGFDFKPGQLTSSNGSDELTLAAADSAAADKLKPGQTSTARVTLKDGRKVSLKVAVGPSRPKVALIGKSVQGADPASSAIPIQLAGADELPQTAQLTFSLKAEGPLKFTGHEAVEVSAAGGAATTMLTPGAGLTQEDPQVMLATLDAGKAFGGSAFGPLQYRLVADGVPGDWQPLATLVRLPTLRDLKCAGHVEHGCELEGSNLFLIEAVSADPAFSHAVRVPEGFPGVRLSVPHPAEGKLYLRLHDDPGVVNLATFPAHASALAEARTGR